MRNHLKIPTETKNGIYISDTYTLGTASDRLKPSDVLLAVGGVEIDSRGRFLHERLADKISFEYLITSRPAGEPIALELWRDGEKLQLETEIKRFRAEDMLIPYYQPGSQPQYAIIGGALLQELTRSYLSQWGRQLESVVSPMLYKYMHEMAFKPSEQKRRLVILSYVLPAQINLGYHSLRQLLVKSINGMPIADFADVIAAQKLNPESKYDLIEFEFDNPTLVIRRDRRAVAEATIGQLYGIDKLVNVTPDSDGN